MRHSGKLMITVGTIFLAACTSNSLRSNETETLIPHILDDGTKLFEYQLDTPHEDLSKPRLVFAAPQEDSDPNTVPNTQPYTAEEEKTIIEARVMSLLRKKLRATGYCREGFVVSNREIGFTHSSINGECREEASAADREQFSQ